MWVRVWVWVRVRVRVWVWVSYVRVNGWHRDELMSPVLQEVTDQLIEKIEAAEAHGDSFEVEYLYLVVAS